MSSLKKSILLLSCAVLVTCFFIGQGSAYAESYNTTWTYTYGNNYDYANSNFQTTQQTSDGGYIVARSDINDGVGVVKLDLLGNVQWQKSYGGGYGDYANAIQQTVDGGYIVAAVTIHFTNGNSDAWVLKLDSSGNIQWQKNYGRSSWDYANSIQQTADGGYIVAGETRHFNAYNGDAWVLKLDANGNIQWQKAYGGSDYEYGKAIRQTTDGGYVVVGDVWNAGAGSWDAWVLKLDANGNIQWQKAYGETDRDYANSIQRTADGGYIVAGETHSFNDGFGDAWVLKLDANGNIQWQKAYGGNSHDYAKSIQQTTDGGYIIVGSTASLVSTYDAWVLKLDANGNIQWQKAYGGLNPDYGDSIYQTTDGGYVVASTSASFEAGGYYRWVLKLDSNGDIFECSNIMKAITSAVNNTSATLIDTVEEIQDTNVIPFVSSAVARDTYITLGGVCVGDTTPPVITISATPNILWPPNHKLVNVLIDGSAQDNESGIESIVITVTDEYGIYNITVPGFGNTIQLEAWREGNDLDGRRYTITVIAKDKAGNQSTATTEVIVPHDMGK